MCKDVDLYKENTMRLHSIAKEVLYPESIPELQNYLNLQIKSGFHLIAAGSNVILPEKLIKPVISLMKLDDCIEMFGDLVEVGCSVRVQKLIRFLQKNNFGGIEYLYSVPASVGGLVYMNGGRGRKYNKSISDFLVKVDYLDLNDNEIHTYKVEKSDFSYRHSPFQDMDAIILKCYFRFLKQDSKTTEANIQERMKHSRERLSADKPSCGTVFCKGNRLLYRLMKGMKVGGAQFSSKTPNWISNVGNATYDDICKLIKKAEFLHKLFLSDCKIEWKIIREDNEKD